MTFLTGLTAYALTALAMTLVYSAVAFVNGTLLPAMLGQLYQAVPSGLWRLVLCVPPLLIPANLFIARAYTLVGPGWAGAGLVVNTVLAMVITALLLEGARVSWQIALGTALAAAGCLIVVADLARQSQS